MEDFASAYEHLQLLPEHTNTFATLVLQHLHICLPDQSELLRPDSTQAVLDAVGSILTTRGSSLWRHGTEPRKQLAPLDTHFVKACALVFPQDAKSDVRKTKLGPVPQRPLSEIEQYVFSTFGGMIKRFCRTLVSRRYTAKGAAERLGMLVAPIVGSVCEESTILQSSFPAHKKERAT